MVKKLETNSNFDPKLVQRFLKEYHDRGMMKWQGFMLSDHTAELNKMERSQTEREQRKHSVEMSVEEISKAIQLAQLKN